MTIRRIVPALGITAAALFLMIATASASTITYSTNSALTIFVGGTDVFSSTGGSAATLTFTPNLSSTSGTPSNINYGDFLLACPTCGTQTSGLGTHFNAFTFDLVVIDTTDNVQGEFIGTSTGGSVWSDVSQISVTWLPLQLGPGTSGVLAGLGPTFNTTYFTISTPTLIVAPNSGCTSGTSGPGCGDTTVQGTVNEASGTPEPTTFLLLGSALLGLGVLRRKRA
jgi:hypothetical protein